MKFKVMFLLFIIFVINTISKSTIDEFEGKVYYNLNIEGKNTEIILIKKGQKAKTKINYGFINLTLMLLNDEKKMITLMEGQKTAIVTDLKENSKQIKTNKAYTFTLTGNTKQINGFDCQQICYTKENGLKVDIWVSKSYSNLEFIKNGMRLNDTEIINSGIMELSSKTVKLTVTKVEKVTISDNEFSIPANFSKIDAPSSISQGITEFFGK